MDLVVVGLTFAAIFLVELPDKTFIATLVLATKYRPILVWIGVGLAFPVQTLVAVALGKAASFLPDGPRARRAAVIFLIGAVLLLREARSADAAEAETRRASTPPGPATRRRPQGGRRQLPGAVRRGVGRPLAAADAVPRREVRRPGQRLRRRLAALLAVSGLAVVLGRVLLNYIKLRTLHYLGGGVCLLLFAITVYELLA